MKIRKWIISTVTIGLLAASGYTVKEWDDVKGYIIEKDGKETAFNDSTDLANFGVMGKARSGYFVAGGK